MTRGTVAFLVAPLWVPITVALLSRSFLFPYTGQWRWIVISTLLAALFSYAGMFAIGLPALFVLSRLGFVQLWSALIVGALASVAVWTAFFAFFSLYLGTFAYGFLWEGVLGGLLPSMLLGVVVATTFWTILRPDRESPNPRESAASTSDGRVIRRSQAGSRRG